MIHTHTNEMLKMCCKLLSFGYRDIWLLQTFNKNTPKSIKVVIKEKQVVSKEDRSGNIRWDRE